MKSQLLLLTLVAAGCEPGPTTFAGDTFVRPPSADEAVLREALATRGDGPNGAHIIFLNFGGQALSPAPNGQDDPDTGASWIAKSSFNMPAFDATPYKGQFTAAQAQASIVSNFSQFYSPFNVQVVTARPTGGQRYTMCVIGGTASMLLGSSAGNAAGIAPLDCGNSDESEITYAFSASIAPNMTGLSLPQTLKSIAVTAAQETAHSYGLNHTDNTTDIMYPQLDPAQTEFVDATMNLIQNSSGTCNKATMQDSKQLLLNNIGASNGSNPTGPLPTVSFAAPTAGQTVPLTFTIIVNAAETGGSIAHVDVEAGMTSIFSSTTAPYRDTLSTTSQGQVELTATAYDAAGNFQTTSVMFTLSKSAPPQVLPPCTGPSDCLTTQTCTNGQCVGSSTTGSTTSTTGSTTSTTGSTTSTTGSTTSTTGSTTSTTGGTSSLSGGTTAGGIITGIPIGGDCTENDQCRSSICDTRSGHKYCTSECDPAAPICPVGLACVADSGTHLCQKPDSSGCSAAPGARSGSELGFLLMMGLIAVLRLRRARA